MTDQAIAYMRRMGSQPWVLHLSYVKPHWPYMAPAPYHAMYRADQCLPVRAQRARNCATRTRCWPPTGSRRNASASSATTASAPCARPTRA